MKQKYVTFNTYGEEQHLIAFPNFIQHSVFAEKVQEASPYKPMIPISAGFIVDSKCEGTSESLRLNSRPKEDTDLLIKLLGISVESLVETIKPKEISKNKAKRMRKSRNR